MSENGKTAERKSVYDQPWEDNYGIQLLELCGDNWYIAINPATGEIVKDLKLEDYKRDHETCGYDPYSSDKEAWEGLLEAVGIGLDAMYLLNIDPLVVYDPNGTLFDASKVE